MRLCSSVKTEDIALNDHGLDSKKFFAPGAPSRFFSKKRPLLAQAANVLVGTKLSKNRCAQAVQE
jgi:hypothetical protein